ncbi:hypothetical protein TNCV_2970841 [Trichonephila clavipes]|nr:hypothetical protein TNCV_2970841 [Trichonephila clavipes]
MRRSLAMLALHKAAQRRRNMCCVKKFVARLVARRSHMPYRPKGRRYGPNIDRETLLNCTWLRKLRILLSPHMGVMLITVLLFLFFFSASLTHSLQQGQWQPCIPV